MTDVCGTGVEENINGTDFNIHLNKNNISSILKAENEVRKFKMNYETHRIESFYNWPCPYISYSKLAKNGFFYSGFGDRVKCNFCDIVLLKWKPQDEPEKEHEKWSPHCRFVLKKKTNNIPIEQSTEKYNDFITFLQNHTIAEKKKVRFICECSD